MKGKTKYPNIENCNPSGCISRKMMMCNRIVANVFRKYLSPFKVTDSQLSILFILAKGTDINQKKLADFLSLEKSSVNRNLKRLLSNKLITYSSGTTLALTKEGKSFLEKVIPQWNKAMAEIKSILDEDGENHLNLLVQKLSS